MKNVLAVTIALMLAAVILSPAIGYSFKAGSNESYSIVSTKVNYSISSGNPAQNLTPGSISAEGISTSEVKVTPTPYSFKLGNTTGYSFTLPSNVTVTPEGLTTMPGVVALGSMAKS